MTPLCQPEDSAILVIDIQDRLLPAMAGSNELVERTTTLLRCAAILGVPILATEQYPQGLGATVASIGEYLPPPIEKVVFSAYGPLREDIEGLGRRTLVVVGMEAHVCVLQTTMEALEAGYHVQVVADAVASRLDRNKNLALERCREAGATITCVESVVFEWLGSADSDSFREVSRLLR